MKKVLLLLSTVFYFKILSNPVFSSNNYQDEMLSYVKSLLPSDPVILEAGGNNGEDTRRMKTVWPNAIVHVFEPLPSSFKKMIDNTKDLSSVFCYNAALTTYSGKTNFYIDIPNNAASSIGYPVEFNEDEFDKDPIEVPCTTINQWASINNVSKIDFLWLDMEGHELYALKYSSDVLKTVKAIFTEVNIVPVRKGSCLYVDLKNFLEAEGFVEVFKKMANHRFGDALFIRK
jgi:FkbM family methyltransferase